MPASPSLRSALSARSGAVRTGPRGIRLGLAAVLFASLLAAFAPAAGANAAPPPAPAGLEAVVGCVTADGTGGEPTTVYVDPGWLATVPDGSVITLHGSRADELNFFDAASGTWTGRPIDASSIGVPQCTGVKSGGTITDPHWAYCFNHNLNVCRTSVYQSVASLPVNRQVGTETPAFTNDTSPLTAERYTQLNWLAMHSGTGGPADREHLAFAVWCIANQIPDGASPGFEPYNGAYVPRTGGGKTTWDHCPIDLSQTKTPTNVFTNDGADRALSPAWKRLAANGDPSSPLNNNWAAVSLEQAAAGAPSVAIAGPSAPVAPGGPDSVHDHALHRSGEPRRARRSARDAVRRRHERSGRRGTLPVFPEQRDREHGPGVPRWPAHRQSRHARREPRVPQAGRPLPLLRRPQLPGPHPDGRDTAHRGRDRRGSRRGLGEAPQARPYGLRDSARRGRLRAPGRGRRDRRDAHDRRLRRRIRDRTRTGRLPTGRDERTERLRPRPHGARGPGVGSGRGLGRRRQHPGDQHRRLLGDQARHRGGRGPDPGWNRVPRVVRVRTRRRRRQGSPHARRRRERERDGSARRDRGHPLRGGPFIDRGHRLRAPVFTGGGVSPTADGATLAIGDATTISVALENPTLVPPVPSLPGIPGDTDLPSAGPQPSLAETGTLVAGIAVPAIVLLLAGAGLTAVRRRRTTRR